MIFLSWSFVANAEARDDVLNKSSVVGVEWQKGGAFDLGNEHWRLKVFSSEDVFGIGEMKL